MAPIAIDAPAQLTADKIPGGLSAGQYKSSVYSGPKTYDAKGEEHGIDGFGKAAYPNYLPTWDFSTKSV